MFWGEQEKLYNPRKLRKTHCIWMLGCPSPRLVVWQNRNGLFLCALAYFEDIRRSHSPLNSKSNFSPADTDSRAIVEPLIMVLYLACPHCRLIDDSFREFDSQPKAIHLLPSWRAFIITFLVSKVIHVLNKLKTSPSKNRKTWEELTEIFGKGKQSTSAPSSKWRLIVTMLTLGGFSQVFFISANRNVA